MTGQLHQCSLPSVKVYFPGSMSFTAKLVKSRYCLKKVPPGTLRLPIHAQGRAPLNSWQCGQLLSFAEELQVGSKRNHDWDLKASVCLAAMSLLEAVRKHPARAGDRFGAASREGCTNVRVPAGLPLSLKVSRLWKRKSYPLQSPRAEWIKTKDWVPIVVEPDRLLYLAPVHTNSVYRKSRLPQIPSVSTRV